MKTKEQPKQSIASQVRALDAEGKKRNEIVQIMTGRLGRPIRYQHVFNILEQARLQALDKANRGTEESED